MCVKHQWNASEIRVWKYVGSSVLHQSGPLAPAPNPTQGATEQRGILARPVVEQGRKSICTSGKLLLSRCLKKVENKSFGPNLSPSIFSSLLSSLLNLKKKSLEQRKKIKHVSLKIFFLCLALLVSEQFIGFPYQLPKVKLGQLGQLFWFNCCNYMPPHVGQLIENIKQSKFPTNVALGQQ